MKLKRFNENTENNFDKIVQDFRSKLEKYRFTNEDILYYFSEFTDKCEYEYDIIRVNEDLSSIVNHKSIENRLIFKKTYQSNNKIVNTIQSGEELKIFLSNLNQFKEVEEGVEDIKEDLSIDKNEITIRFSFRKIVPSEIINGYKNELEKEKDRKRLGGSISNDYGIDRQIVYNVMDEIDKSDVIDPQDISRLLNIDINDIEIDFEYEIEIDDNGDRIIHFIPIVVIDGDINDNISQSLSDILYNYDNDEFLSQ